MSRCRRFLAVLGSGTRLTHTRTSSPTRRHEPPSSCGCASQPRSGPQNAERACGVDGVDAQVLVRRERHATTVTPAAPGPSRPRGQHEEDPVGAGRHTRLHAAHRRPPRPESHGPDEARRLRAHHHPRSRGARRRGRSRWRPRVAATGADDSLNLVFAKGLEHERAYLERLVAEGRVVEDIAALGLRGVEAEAATVDAMRRGVDVIYQATFFDGHWVGLADFLLRVDEPSDLGPWRYDIADTKLARRLKVPALLQMATYAARLELLQGVPPQWLTVVTGDAESHPWRLVDVAPYARRRRAELLDAIAHPRETESARVQHCGQCRWKERCAQEWLDRDDLDPGRGHARRPPGSAHRPRHPDAAFAGAVERGVAGTGPVDRDATSAAPAGPAAARRARDGSGAVRAARPRAGPGPADAARARRGRRLPRLRG